MLTGFTVSAIGIIFCIKMQHSNPPGSKIAFGITIAGIVIYMTGRVGVLIQRRKQRKQRERRVLDSEDEAA